MESTRFASFLHRERHSSHLCFEKYVFKNEIFITELKKRHGYAGITREEGLQNEQSLRQVSCRHTT